VRHVGQARIRESPMFAELPGKISPQITHLRIAVVDSVQHEVRSCLRGPIDFVEQKLQGLSNNVVAKKSWVMRQLVCRRQPGSAIPLLADERCGSEPTRSLNTEGNSRQDRREPCTSDRSALGLVEGACVRSKTRALLHEPRYLRGPHRQQGVSETRRTARGWIACIVPKNHPAFLPWHSHRVRQVFAHCVHDLWPRHTRTLCNSAAQLPATPPSHSGCRGPRVNSAALLRCRTPAPPAPAA